MNYRDWCESMNCVYTPLSLTEAAWDAATRESFKVIMKVSERANTLAERVKELEAKQADDEGSVRVPVAFIEELLDDRFSDFRKPFGDRLRAMLVAAKERT